MKTTTILLKILYFSTVLCTTKALIEATTSEPAAILDAVWRQRAGQSPTNTRKLEIIYGRGGKRTPSIARISRTNIVFDNQLRAFLQLVGINNFNSCSTRQTLYNPIADQIMIRLEHNDYDRRQHHYYHHNKNNN